MDLKKICTTCKQEKSINEYHSHKRCLYGVRNECKVCRIKRQKKYQLKNTEKIKKYFKKYYNDNILKWKKRQESTEYKDKKNEDRRMKYANDKKYRDYVNKKVKEYRDRDPLHKIKKRIRNHGITIDDYNNMLIEQDNKCAICKSSKSNTKLTNVFYIDHDHKTGKVRGLLCNKCNFALGQFNDDISILQNAIKYLKRNIK